MKTNIKKTKERNNLPIYIVFGLLFSFFLGLVNSPNKYKYTSQSIIPSIEPAQTKIETVFIEKVIEPIKVKVDTTETIVPENDALEGVTIIDEDSYGKRCIKKTS